MWNYKYILGEKLVAKNGNEWYNIVVTPNGATSEDDRALGTQLYKAYRTNVQAMNYDMDEVPVDATSGPAPDLDKSEF